LAFWKTLTVITSISIETFTNPSTDRHSFDVHPQAGHHEAGTCEMLSPPFSPRLDEKSNIYILIVNDERIKAISKAAD